LPWSKHKVLKAILAFGDMLQVVRTYWNTFSHGWLGVTHYYCCDCPQELPLGHQPRRHG